MRSVLGGEIFNLLPSSYNPDLAEAVVRFAYRRRNTYDMILISGDLATTGTNADLQVAREFTNSKSVNAYLNSGSKPSLQGCSRPIFAMPGNHDRYRDNKGRPGSVHFDLVFPEIWGSDHRNFNQTVLAKGILGDRLALVAVDFCLRTANDASAPRHFNRLGQGKAYEDLVDELMNRTSVLRSKYENLIVAWIMHFPPVALPQRSLELQERERVQNAAIDAGIPVILAGHIHESRTERIHDTRIWCAGSGTSVEAKGIGNSIHLIDFIIDKGTLKSVDKVDYVWSQVRGDFVLHN